MFIQYKIIKTGMIPDQYMVGFESQYKNTTIIVLMDKILHFGIDTRVNIPNIFCSIPDTQQAINRLIKQNKQIEEMLA